MEARDEGRGKQRVRKMGVGLKKRGGYGCMKTNDANLSGH